MDYDRESESHTRITKLRGKIRKKYEESHDQWVYLTCRKSNIPKPSSRRGSTKTADRISISNLYGVPHFPVEVIGDTNYTERRPSLVPIKNKTVSKEISNILPNFFGNKKKFRNKRDVSLAIKTSNYDRRRMEEHRRIQKEKEENQEFQRVISRISINSNTSRISDQEKIHNRWDPTLLNGGSIIRNNVQMTPDNLQKIEQNSKPDSSDADDQGINDSNKPQDHQHTYNGESKSLASTDYRMREYKEILENYEKNNDNKKSSTVPTRFSNALPLSKNCVRVYLSSCDEGFEDNDGIDSSDNNNNNQKVPHQRGKTNIQTMPSDLTIITNINNRNHSNVTKNNSNHIDSSAKVNSAKQFYDNMRIKNREFNVGAKNIPQNSTRNSQGTQFSNASVFSYDEINVQDQIQNQITQTQLKVDFKSVDYNNFIAKSNGPGTQDGLKSLYTFDQSVHDTNLSETETQNSTCIISQKGSTKIKLEREFSRYDNIRSVANSTTAAQSEIEQGIDKSPVLTKRSLPTIRNEGEIYGYGRRKSKLPTSGNRMRRRKSRAERNKTSVLMQNNNSNYNNNNNTCNQNKIRICQSLPFPEKSQTSPTNIRPPKFPSQQIKTTARKEQLKIGDCDNGNLSNKSSTRTLDFRATVTDNDLQNKNLGTSNKRKLERCMRNSAIINTCLATSECSKTTDESSRQQLIPPENHSSSHYGTTVVCAKQIEARYSANADENTMLKETSTDGVAYSFNEDAKNQNKIKNLEEKYGCKLRDKKPICKQKSDHSMISAISKVSVTSKRASAILENLSKLGSSRTTKLKRHSVQQIDNAADAYNKELDVSQDLLNQLKNLLLEKAARNHQKAMRNKIFSETTANETGSEICKESYRRENRKRKSKRKENNQTGASNIVTNKNVRQSDMIEKVKTGGYENERIYQNIKRNADMTSTIITNEPSISTKKTKVVMSERSLPAIPKVKTSEAYLEIFSPVTELPQSIYGLDSTISVEIQKKRSPCNGLSGLYEYFSNKMTSWCHKMTAESKNL